MLLSQSMRSVPTGQWLVPTDFPLPCGWIRNHLSQPTQPAQHRQRFLAEQGYAYRIIDAEEIDRVEDLG